MKKHIFTVLFALLSRAHATVYDLSPWQDTTTIQSIINNAAVGSTVAFGQGTYQITSGLTLKCGVTYTAATPATPSNVILSASFAEESTDIFTLNAGCTSATTISYLSALHAGLLFVSSPNSDLTVTHNQVGDLKCCNSQVYSPALYFNDPSSGDTNFLTNATVTWNQLGDLTSCTTPGGSDSSFSGNWMNDTESPEVPEMGECAGMVIQTSVNGVIFEYNNILHVEEGVHILCYGSRCSPGDPGGPGPLTYNVTAQYNDFNQIHRIAWEEQPEAITAVTYQFNSEHDWFVPYYGAFGISMACCANPASFAPYLNVLDNVVIFNTSPGSGRYGYGMEAFGNQAHYDHNLVQSGTFPLGPSGMSWGLNCCSNLGWSFSYDQVQGGFPSGYINAEFNNGVTPPTQTANITGPTVSAITSTAPTISPSSGSKTFPLAVTLTDTGLSSTMTGPTGNTGIWYTTDGTTPVPGLGSAQYLASGGSFVLSSAATVKAVGMWGAPNQPTSYPSGYGYVPSPVISAVFKGGSGSRLVRAYLVSNGGVKSIPVGGTLQFIAHGVYSDGTSAVLPDSEGNVVTAWNTSDHAVAKISTLGHVTAMGVGTATIEAFIGNLEASTSEVAVTPIVASSVLVRAYLVSNGGVKSIPVGKTLQFIAHGVYSDGTSAVLPDSKGNAVTAWNTSNHNIAKISSLGHVTAMGVGMATIQAFIGNLEASTSEVAVTPIVASSVQPAAVESPLAPRIESPSGLVPAVPGSPIGDKFLGPLWKVFAPAGGSASISNGHLFLSVPGGSNHDTLLPSNQAVRAVQAIGDADFDVSIKIDSEIDASNADTSQGLMVLSDGDAFITLALTTDGTNIGLVARTVNAGVSTTVLEDTSFAPYQNPMYLRLARSGDAYMASYSIDGAHWTQATSFTDTGTYTSIGPFDSNYNNSPQKAVPVVMSVDWFNVE